MSYATKNQMNQTGLYSKKRIYDELLDKFPQYANIYKIKTNSKTGKELIYTIDQNGNEKVAQKSDLMYAYGKEIYGLYKSGNLSSDFGWSGFRKSQHTPKKQLGRSSVGSTSSSSNIGSSSVQTPPQQPPTQQPTTVQTATTTQAVPVQPSVQPSPIPATPQGSFSGTRVMDMSDQEFSQLITNAYLDAINKSGQPSRQLATQFNQDPLQTDTFEDGIDRVGLAIEGLDNMIEDSTKKVIQTIDPTSNLTRDQLIQQYNDLGIGYIRNLPQSVTDDNLRRMLLEGNKIKAQATVLALYKDSYPPYIPQDYERMGMNVFIKQFNNEMASVMFANRTIRPIDIKFNKNKAYFELFQDNKHIYNARSMKEAMKIAQNGGSQSNEFEVLNKMSREILNKKDTKKFFALTRRL